MEFLEAVKAAAKYLKILFVASKTTERPITGTAKSDNADHGNLMCSLRDKMLLARCLNMALGKYNYLSYEMFTFYTIRRKKLDFNM